MIAKPFLLFTISTLLEMILLVKLAQWMGILPTIGLVLLTGIIGAFLAKLEGFRVIHRIRRDLSRGELPGDALLDGLCVIIAAALLVTPGVVTDFVGFALLIPVARAPLKRAFVGRFTKWIETGAATYIQARSERVLFTGGRGFADDDTIDAEGVRVPYDTDEDHVNRGGARIANPD